MMLIRTNYADMGALIPPGSTLDQLSESDFLIDLDVLMDELPEPYNSINAILEDVIDDFFMKYFHQRETQNMEDGPLPILVNELNQINGVSEVIDILSFPSEPKMLCVIERTCIKILSEDSDHSVIATHFAENFREVLRIEPISFQEYLIFLKDGTNQLVIFYFSMDAMQLTQVYTVACQKFIWLGLDQSITFCVIYGAQMNTNSDVEFFKISLEDLKAFTLTKPKSASVTLGITITTDDNDGSINPDVSLPNSTKSFATSKCITSVMKLKKPAVQTFGPTTYAQFLKSLEQNETIGFGINQVVHENMSRMKIVANQMKNDKLIEALFQAERTYSGWYSAGSREDYILKLYNQPSSTLNTIPSIAVMNQSVYVCWGGAFATSILQYPYMDPSSLTTTGKESISLSGVNSTTAVASAGGVVQQPANVLPFAYPVTCLKALDFGSSSETDKHEETDLKSYSLADALAGTATSLHLCIGFINGTFLIFDVGSKFRIGSIKKIDCLPGLPAQIDNFEICRTSRDGENVIEKSLVVWGIKTDEKTSTKRVVVYQMDKIEPTGDGMRSDSKARPSRDMSIITKYNLKGQTVMDVGLADQTRMPGLAVVRSETTVPRSTTSSKQTFTDSEQQQFSDDTQRTLTQTLKEPTIREPTTLRICDIKALEKNPTLLSFNLPMLSTPQEWSELYTFNFDLRRIYLWSKTPLDDKLKHFEGYIDLSEHYDKLLSFMCVAPSSIVKIASSPGLQPKEEGVNVDKLLANFLTRNIPPPSTKASTSDVGTTSRPS